MAIAHVRTPLIYTVFEDKSCGGSYSGSLHALNKSFPILGTQRADKSGSRQRDSDDIRGQIHTFLHPCTGNNRRGCLSSGLMWKRGDNRKDDHNNLFNFHVV